MPALSLFSHSMILAYNRVTCLYLVCSVLCHILLFAILLQANARHVQPTDVAEQATHAAAPADLDPNLVEEGYVAYKNLLGPNQNISHISGADVEAHEFQTVADRLNFEVKRTLFLRFKIMVLVYLMATLCKWCSLLLGRTDVLDAASLC